MPLDMFGTTRYIGVAPNNRTYAGEGRNVAGTSGLFLWNFTLLNFASTGNTGVWSEYYNGTQVNVTGGQTTGLNAADNGNAIFFGVRGGSQTAMNANYCEVLLYNSNLTIANRQLIEGYLAWKWGIRTSLPVNHPYYNNDPTVTLPPLSTTTAGPSMPTSLGQQATTTTGFTVTWSNGNGATSYQYYINNVLTTPATDNGVSANNAVFTGLTLGSTYTFRLQAINASGSSNSSTATFYTLLNQPIGLSSSNITQTGFTISWAAISGPTNLRYILNGNSIIPASTTSTSATFIGLTLFTVYRVIISNVYNSVSNDSSPLIVTTLNIFTPLSVSNLILWVDGSDPLNNGAAPANGTALTTWFDKSGNSNNMTALVNGTYASNSQNGRGTITFTSSVYRSAITNIPYYPADAYIVVRVNSASTANDICGVCQLNADNFNSLTFGEYSTSKWHNGSSGFSRTPNAVASVTETSTSFLIMSWSIANNNFYIYRNGVQIMVTSSYSWTPTASVIFSLGTRVDVNAGNRLQGSIAEAVLYTTQLNTTNRQQVEGFLAWKWGLQTQLPSNHPYFNFAP